LQEPPDPPPAVTSSGRSSSELGRGSTDRKRSDAMGSRSIFNTIGETFSSSFSMMGLGTQRLNQTDPAKPPQPQQDPPQPQAEDLEEAAGKEAGAKGGDDVPFGKTNSELLKEVFSLRREVVQCRAEMQKKDREIAELRDNEADLKLRLVRAEAHQKLPLAVSATKTQRLIAEEAERLTSVYVPMLRELSDEVEALKKQLADKTDNVN